MSGSSFELSWKAVVVSIAMTGFCTANAQQAEEADVAEGSSPSVLVQLVDSTTSSANDGETIRATAKTTASPTGAEIQLSEEVIELILAADEETVDYLLNDALDFHKVFLGSEATGS